MPYYSDVHINVILRLPLGLRRSVFPCNRPVLHLRPLLLGKECVGNDDIESVSVFHGDKMQYLHFSPHCFALR
jgi:hypothetical protein